MLDTQIVKKRKDFAPQIQSLMDTANLLSANIDKVIAAAMPVTNSEPDSPDNARLERYCAELKDVKKSITDLSQRAKVKHRRFDSGVVSVAICGLMKAGKTTLIKNLTDIPELPAFPEKCTAVSTEIIYDKDAEPYAEIDYFREDEYLDRVINTKLKMLNRSVASLAEFETLQMHEWYNECEAGTAKYLTLEDLLNLQKNLKDIRKYLDQDSKVLNDLSLLGQEIAYPPKATQEESALHDARVSAAKRCRIYCKFPGGSEHLRILDTAGTDDPNPKVVQDTLLTLGESADALVVASRPCKKPEPGNDFYNFWRKLSELPDEIHFLDRLIFLLNWDRVADADKAHINTHRSILESHGVPSRVFTDAIDCSTPDGAREVMDRVNRHLLDSLVKQDRRGVEKLKSELHQLQNVRLWNLCRELRSVKPVERSTEVSEIQLFDDWFDGSPDPEDYGFIGRLRLALDEAVTRFEKEDQFQIQDEELQRVLEKSKDDLKGRLPEQEEMDKRRILDATTNVFEKYMKEFYLMFSDLADSLADMGQEFAPVIQRTLVQILDDAGLGNLLQGETEAEQLHNLKEMLPEENVLYKVVERALKRNEQIIFVMRHRLRPALNFTNPFRWEDGKAWKEFEQCYKEHGFDKKDLNDFSSYNGIPHPGKRKELGEIVQNAYDLIHKLAGRPNIEIREIANDVLLDFQLRLGLVEDLEKELKNGLRLLRGRILGTSIETIRRQSEMLARLQTAIETLASQCRR